MNTGTVCHFHFAMLRSEKQRTGECVRSDECVISDGEFITTATTLFLSSLFHVLSFPSFSPFPHSSISLLSPTPLSLSPFPHSSISLLSPTPLSLSFPPSSYLFLSVCLAPSLSSLHPPLSLPLYHALSLSLSVPLIRSIILY